MDTVALEVLEVALEGAVEVTDLVDMEAMVAVLVEASEGDLAVVLVEDLAADLEDSEVLAVVEPEVSEVASVLAEDTEDRVVLEEVTVVRVGVPVVTVEADPAGASLDPAADVDLARVEVAGGRSPPLKLQRRLPLALAVTANNFTRTIKTNKKLKLIQSDELKSKLSKNVLKSFLVITLVTMINPI